uniref:Uncharacterized protein n=1 Tax=Tetraodon nigroviridis TaxID=99883 RepID=H3C651_TETNG
MQRAVEATVHIHRFPVGSSFWILLFRADRRQVWKKTCDLCNDGIPSSCYHHSNVFKFLDNVLHPLLHHWFRTGFQLCICICTGHRNPSWRSTHHVLSSGCLR